MEIKKNFEIKKQNHQRIIKETAISFFKACGAIKKCCNHVIFNKMLTPLSRGIVARKISSAQLEGTLEAGRSG